MITIPSSWSCVPIGNICDLINGRAFKPSDWGKEGLPIVRIQNLNDPNAGFNYYPKSIEEKFLIDQGQLLFAWSGTPGTSFGAHIWNGGRAVLNQHIFRVEFDDSKINKKYFCYAINQKLNELIEKAHGGVGLRHVTKGKFEATEIAIPPLNEQKRIIAKIEELFSELDKGIENFSTAQAQLKVYRQAILKHAFKGKLTSSGKRKNCDTSKFKNFIPGKEVEHFPKLPTGWLYTQVGEVIEEPKYGTSKKCDYDITGIGVLRIPNIVSGIVDSTDLKFANFDAEEINTYGLHQGDILIIRSNGSVSIVGKCALVREQDEKFLYAGYLIRLRPNKELISPEFLSYVLSSHPLRTQIERKAKSTSGVNNINAGELQSLVV